MDRKKELVKGLKQTSSYLLSHHRPEKYYRCYSVSVQNKELKICSRCLGIYTGILLGLLTGLYIGELLRPTLLALLVIPSFIEKYLTSLKNHRGFNSIRSLTGILLGVAYSQALILIYQNPIRPFLLTLGALSVLISFLMIKNQGL